eukprot:IDg12835t1
MVKLRRTMRESMSVEQEAILTARQALAYMPARRRSPGLSTSSYVEKLDMAFAVPECTLENLCGALFLLHSHEHFLLPDAEQHPNPRVLLARSFTAQRNLGAICVFPPFLPLYFS